MLMDHRMNSDGMKHYVPIGDTRLSMFNMRDRFRIDVFHIIDLIAFN